MIKLIVEANECSSHIIKYSLLRLKALEKPIWRLVIIGYVQSPVDTYPLFADMVFIGGVVQFRPSSRLVNDAH